MSGIDRKRVVGKTEYQLDNIFTCIICRNIFDEPVFTYCCCWRTFCKVCIHQWLEDNNTCPNCWNALTINQLLRAPRVFENMINKIKIKCGNYGTHCKSVITIREMKAYNTCDSCKTLKKFESNENQNT